MAALRASYHRILDRIEHILPAKLRPLYNHPAGKELMVVWMFMYVEHILKRTRAAAFQSSAYIAQTSRCFHVIISFIDNLLQPDLIFLECKEFMEQ